jgi:hypothetical protein
MESAHQFPIEDGVSTEPMEGDVLAWILHSCSLKLGENGVHAPV